MGLLALVVVLLVLESVVLAVDQPAGFLSIDCGLEADDSYPDDLTGLTYVPDGRYIDGGENHKVTTVYRNKWWGPDTRTLYTVRSFPSGEGQRNCYSLPTDIGSKYLVRLEFLYGNYDGLDSLSLKFNLSLGVNHWDTVSLDTIDGNDDGYNVYEVVFVAWASWAPICLVNIGQGTPFVSTVELRPLGILPYPAVMGNVSLSMYDRCNVGSSPDDDELVRYPDDQYDRFWFTDAYTEADPLSTNISTQSTIQPSTEFAVPSPVLQKAVVPSGNSTKLVFFSDQLDALLHDHFVILHFADFQNKKSREFTVSIDNGVQSSPYSTPYLKGLSVTGGWSSNSEGKYNFTIAATATSALPPILNAYEVYGRIIHDNPTTFSQDFDAIMAIKYEYGIKKNWMGDPCFPPEYVWDGVKCSDAGDKIMRIISIDLSNSELNGSISNSFTLFTALKYLNLSCNQLNGTIPDSLLKNNGSIDFSYESDGNMCKTHATPSLSRNRAVTLAVSVVAPVLVLAILVLAYLIWRAKRKLNTSSTDLAMVPELMSAPGHITNHWDHLQKPENRRFTYQELEKFTENFKHLIGHGGFGHVYYGCLEDSTEVAVKMRSELSSHGLNEFLAEVQSLTKVHHRNLVCLVGYCWEKEHLALVYEYMSRGNLCDYLRGKTGVGEILNWKTRVRVALEAAQGLDYLHKGCNLPIIHGDVKTNNILLAQNFKAKIADFGLSKTYHSDSQTHISAAAAGSMGYIDPEYYTTGRLTESSDVYSFGVVLLEITTGEPPIIPENGHIVQRVKQKIVSGNISLVADAHLGGAYNVSSMWKVVNIAMMCTTDIATQRPKMGDVVVQLKESLDLVEVHGDRGDMENLASDTMSSMSTFGPSAR
ncbi:probable LRR receptor-like protein kinase At1g51890 [Oryza glaberrima]|uniref:probable LRR receptor-like protein kinase At1g51890 n=1 Tax=Oryza glaberrima TaxID=4538 RepID=UPI00224C1D3A|nr:probable LRR receptor-like protein kinase At1g51890 [Oryza glaberrima]